MRRGPKSSVTSILITRGNLDTETQTGGRPHKQTHREDEHLSAKKRGLHQSLPFEPSQGTHPCLELVASRTVRQYISVVYATHFMVFCYSSLANQHLEIYKRQKEPWRRKTFCENNEKSINSRSKQTWIETLTLLYYPQCQDT